MDWWVDFVMEWKSYKILDWWSDEVIEWCEITWWIDLLIGWWIDQTDGMME